MFYVSKKRYDAQEKKLQEVEAELEQMKKEHKWLVDNIPMPCTNRDNLLFIYSAGVATLFILFFIWFLVRVF